MNATRASVLIAEVPGYAKLQCEIHDALRVQHPEWIDEHGNSPTCDSYEARFAKLLVSHQMKSCRAGDAVPLRHAVCRDGILRQETWSLTDAACETDRVGMKSLTNGGQMYEQND